MTRVAPRNAGFTLLEVLIALSLIGVLMTLVYTGMYTGMRSWTAVEKRSAQAVSGRTVRNWLHRQVSALVPVQWKQNLKKQVAFRGDDKGFSFYGFLEHPTRGGGVYLVDLLRQPVEKDFVLRLSYRQRGDEPRRLAGVGEAEVRDLGGPFTDIRFEYFGKPDDKALEQWRRQWPPSAESYPSLIRISGQLADGRPWPELVIPLRSLPEVTVL